jgi:enoyl-CoA hydratase/carnithine racemase
MVMLGEPVSAEEAHRIGLANRVFDDETFRENALDFARKFLSRAPLASGLAKNIINTCQNVDTDTGRNIERLGQSILIRTEDAQDGMQAFRDKRKPIFIGR